MYVTIYVTNQHEKQSVDKECQTNTCHYDLTELSHHFDKLLDEINKIAIGVDALKQLQQHTRKEVKYLKSEIQTVKDMITCIDCSNKTNKGKSMYPFTNHIPIPPPLPPPNFMQLNSCEGSKSLLSLSKIFHNVNISERPVITVEALKSIQLRKVTVTSSNKQIDIVESQHINFKNNMTNEHE